MAPDPRPQLITQIHYCADRDRKDTKHNAISDRLFGNLTRITKHEIIFKGSFGKRRIWQ